MFTTLWNKASTVYNYFYPAPSIPLSAPDAEDAELDKADGSWDLLSKNRAPPSSPEMPLSLSIPATTQRPLKAATLPGAIPTSEENIYRLLQTPSLFQRVIQEGQLRLPPLAHQQANSTPVFIATFFGVSALCCFITEPNGNQALQIGSFIIPLEYVEQPSNVAITELPDSDSDSVEQPPAAEELADGSEEASIATSSDLVLAPPSSASRLAAYLVSWFPTWPFSSPATATKDGSDAENTSQSQSELDNLMDRDEEEADDEDDANLFEESEALKDTTNSSRWVRLRDMLEQTKTSSINFLKTKLSRATTAPSEHDANADIESDDATEEPSKAEKPPEQFAISKERILQLLKSKESLRQLIQSGCLIISPTPISNTTEHPPTYQIEFFGGKLTGNVITQANEEHALRVDDIDIPFKDIYFALNDHQGFDETAKAAVDAEEGKKEEDDNDEENDMPHYPFLEKEPVSFTESLAHLARTIPTIPHQEIKQRAKALHNKLKELHQRGEKPEKLIGYLDITNQLLAAKPGAERQAIARQYRQLATQAQSSHSSAMQALGIAMILLAIAVITVGAFSIPVTPVLGGASVAGGAALLGAGIGLFAHGRPRQDDTHRLMTDLEECIADVEIFRVA